MLARLLILLLVLALATPATAQQSVTPSQKDVIRNARVTSVADTAIAVTIAGITNQRARLQSFAAYCSAGTASITITEGGVTTWTSSTGMIGTTMVGVIWVTPKTVATGAALVVTLGTCGGGNTGTLHVEAEQY